MIDTVYEAWWLSGDTDRDESFLMEIEKGVSFVPDTIGSPIEMTIQQGWCARLSMNGCLDATDWLGPFATEVEALVALDEEHGERCLACGVRVGSGNAFAPCDICEDIWDEVVIGLFLYAEDGSVVADSVFTSAWASGDYSDGAWPCSYFAGRDLLIENDEGRYYVSDVTDYTEDLYGNGDEEVAMCEDIARLVAEHLAGVE